MEPRSSKTPSCSSRCKIDGFAVVRAIIEADEVDLPAVDAAAIVEHLKMGSFSARNGAIFTGAADIGGDVADFDLRVGSAKFSTGPAPALQLQQSKLEDYASCGMAFARRRTAPQNISVSPKKLRPLMLARCTTAIGT